MWCCFDGGGGRWCGCKLGEERGDKLHESSFVENSSNREHQVLNCEAANVTLTSFGNELVLIYFKMILFYGLLLGIDDPVLLLRVADNLRTLFLDLVS